VVVGKFDLRPLFQGTLDAGAEAVVGQQSFGDVGDQNRIADVRVAIADLLDRQVVGQVAGADDFDAVVEDEQVDRRVHEVVAVDEGVDQQLLKDAFWNLRLPERVHSTARLHLVQVAHDEANGIGEDLLQRAFKVLRVRLSGIAALGN
jgi:hypothetical protein